MWKRSTKCESTACVEVGRFKKATHSNPSGNCVEAAREADVILVRDSKDPGGLKLEHNIYIWQGLMECIKREEPVDLRAVFTGLDLSDEELDAFVKGVLDGEFDLQEI